MNPLIALRFSYQKFFALSFLFLFAKVNSAQTTGYWEGTWRTIYGIMTLSQSGADVSGTYLYGGECHIVGTASGNMLTGQWSEPPDYQPPWNQGDFQFTLNDDKTKFTGEWRYADGNNWYTWNGEKGFTIGGYVEGENNQGLAYCEVQLLQGASLVKKDSTNSAGIYLIRNVQPGTYSVKPIHLLYEFEPATRTVTITNDLVLNVDFTSSLNFVLTLKADHSILNFEQQTNLTLELKDNDGNDFAGSYRVEFYEENFLGTFDPPDGITQSWGGEAEMLYRAPKEDEIGSHISLKLKAIVLDFDHPKNFAELIIPLGQEILVWAEPKNPDRPENYPHAIIPADERYPAKINCKSVPDAGGTLVGREVVFSIGSTDKGYLYNLEKTERGRMLSVQTDNEGIASVYYFFSGAVGDTENYTEEVTATVSENNKTGKANVEVGIGLVIDKIERYQQEAGVITYGTNISLVVYLHSYFHPELDLQNYFYAGQKIWDTFVNVDLVVSWFNRPDPDFWGKLESYFYHTEDILYNSYCGFDQLGGNQILFAFGDPKTTVGNDHSFPVIIPYIKGPHYYKVYAEAFSGNNQGEYIHIVQPFFYVDVDRDSGIINWVSCSVTPQTKAQFIIVEMFKAYIPNNWGGMIIDFLDIVCKISEEKYFDALLSIGETAGGMYIDELSELKKNDEWVKNLTEGEFKKLSKAIFTKDAVTFYKRITGIQGLPNYKTSPNNYNSPVEELDVTDVEMHTLANARIIGLLNNDYSNDSYVLSVLNASDVSLTNGDGFEAPLIDYNFENINSFMKTSEDEVTCFILDKNDSYTLDLISSANTSVTLCKPGNENFDLYIMETDQNTSAELDIDISGGGNLMVDYGNDGSIDEEITPQNISPPEVIYDYELEVDWLFGAGGSGDDLGSCLSRMPDGKIVLGVQYAGSINILGESINTGGGLDILIAQINPAGELVWIKSFGGGTSDYIYGLDVNSNSEIVTTGGYHDQIDFDIYPLTSTDGTEDVFITKLDFEGNVLWAISGGGDADDWGKVVGCDANNNIYCAGTVQSNESTFGSHTLNLIGSEDIFVLKTNNNGEVLWANLFGGEGYDKPMALHVFNNGEFIIAGYFREDLTFENTTLTAQDKYDGFLAKFDTDGNLIWVKHISGMDDEKCNDICVDNYGNIFLTGSFKVEITVDNYTISAFGNEDIFICKLNSNGTLEWLQNGGSDREDASFTITLDNNGNIFIGGYISDYGQFGDLSITNMDVEDKTVIVQYDTDGNALSESHSTDNFDRADRCNDLLIDNQGNCYAIGQFTDQVSFSQVLNAVGNQDMYLVKLNQIITGLEINSEPSIEQNNYSLYQNYPNPFNPSTTIEYYLPVQCEVTLQVYNIMGELVEEIVKGVQRSGHQKETWNASNFASGVYFVRIFSRSLKDNSIYSDAKKMILLR